VGVGMPSETPAGTLAKWRQLTAHHRRVAALLAWTLIRLAKIHGLERLGFLTLTFPDHVTDPAEAYRRFKSLTAGVLKVRYLDFVRVFERQENGRIHYHLVVVLRDDIRSGFNFELARDAYRAHRERRFRDETRLWSLAAGDGEAGRRLKAEWAFWRKTSKLYKFGRTELLPIKSTAEGIAKYVGTYIDKHVGHREERDKGVRLVGCSAGAKAGTTRFAWNSPGYWVWRKKLQLFAFSRGCGSMEALLKQFGEKWAWKLTPAILGVPLLVRIGGQVVDVSKYEPATARELYGKYPAASEWGWSSPPLGVFRRKATT